MSPRHIRSVLPEKESTSLDPLLVHWEVEPERSWQRTSLENFKTRTFTVKIKRRKSVSISKTIEKCKKNNIITLNSSSLLHLRKKGTWSLEISVKVNNQKDTKNIKSQLLPLWFWNFIVTNKDLRCKRIRAQVKDNVVSHYNTISITRERKCICSLATYSRKCHWRVTRSVCQFHPPRNTRKKTTFISSDPVDRVHVNVD